MKPVIVLVEIPMIWDGIQKKLWKEDGQNIQGKKIDNIGEYTLDCIILSLVDSHLSATFLYDFTCVSTNDQMIQSKKV